MLEPGSTISSVNSSISTPGGMKRTERANLASSEMERVVGREEDVIRGVEMRFGVRKNRVVWKSWCDWKCEGRKGARFIVMNRHRRISIFFLGCRERGLSFGFRIKIGFLSFKTRQRFLLFQTEAFIFF